MLDTHDWTGLFDADLNDVDPAIGGLIAQEAARNNATLNLIASESYCPRATLQAEASILVTKNATGYPDARAVGGCEYINAIERLAQARAFALFQAEHANVQALSSTIGNIAVLRGLLQPGDSILSMGDSAGGHHSHGARYHVSGHDYAATRFGVDEAKGGIDLDAVRAQARALRPRIIIAGSTAYPRAIDFRGLRAIADEVGALLFADLAHVAGLVVAGLHDNPVPYADVATTSTHKTLCGPRTGGLLLCRAGLAEQIDVALFPGMQGAPGAHIIAARAVLFDLVARPAFTALMRAVVRNARVFAEALAEAGLPLYLGGTDTHMVVVDLRDDRALDGRAIEQLLEAHGLVCNAVSLPARAGVRGRAGLRLGSTAMTIRGLDAAGFRSVARLIAEIVAVPDGPINTRVCREVATLAAACPVPAGSMAAGPMSAGSIPAGSVPAGSMPAGSVPAGSAAAGSTG
jgi:glycine hydroxymethyltransferase